MTKQQAKAPVMDINEVTTAQMTTVVLDRACLVSGLSAADEFKVRFEANEEKFMMEDMLAIKLFRVVTFYV